MAQTDTVKRIKSICDEFDRRMEEVGLATARLEVAKALAECEASKSIPAVLEVSSIECNCKEMSEQEVRDISSFSWICPAHGYKTWQIACYKTDN